MMIFAHAYTKKKKDSDHIKTFCDSSGIEILFWISKETGNSFTNTTKLLKIQQKDLKQFYKPKWKPIKALELKKNDTIRSLRDSKIILEPKIQTSATQ